MPRRAGERPVHGDAHLAHRDDEDGGIREVAAKAEREEPSDDEELVGERIEERAGTGGAVAAGEPAVEPIGAREHEPQGHREPRGAAILDEEERRHREQQARR